MKSDTGGVLNLRLNCVSSGTILILSRINIILSFDKVKPDNIKEFFYLNVSTENDAS